MLQAQVKRYERDGDYMASTEHPRTSSGPGGGDGCIDGDRRRDVAHIIRPWGASDASRERV